MKTTVTLTPEEVKKIVGDYILAQHPQKSKLRYKVRLNAAQGYDRMDQPNGVQFTNAEVELDEIEIAPND